MRRVLVIVMVLMAGLSCSAHEWWVEDDDLCLFGEIGGGVATGANSYNRTIGENRLGGTGYLEARYRCNNRHFDVGLYTSYGEISRESRDSKKYVFSNWDVFATVNYNLYAWRKITPFIGVGGGFVNDTAAEFLIDAILPGEDYDRDCRTGKGEGLGAMVRCGVQVGTHLRVTGGYKWLDRYSSLYFVTLGISVALGSR